MGKVGRRQGLEAPLLMCPRAERLKKCGKTHMVVFWEGHDFKPCRKHHENHRFYLACYTGDRRLENLTKTGDGRGITRPPLKSKPQRLKPRLFRRYLRHD